LRREVKQEETIATPLAFYVHTILHLYNIMESEYLRIDTKNKQAAGEFVGMFFKDQNAIVSYVPSLDLTSYGDNEQEAMEMMEVSIKEFLNDLVNLKSENEIYKTLKSFGWHRHAFFNKRLTNISETTFEDVIKQFGLPENTKAKNLPLAV
jgi:hypothetical protein